MLLWFDYDDILDDAESFSWIPEINDNRPTSSSALSVTFHLMDDHFLMNNADDLNIDGIRFRNRWHPGGITNMSFDMQIVIDSPTWSGSSIIEITTMPSRW